MNPHIQNGAWRPGRAISFIIIWSSRQAERCSRFRNIPGKCRLPRLPFQNLRLSISTRPSSSAQPLSMIAGLTAWAVCPSFWQQPRRVFASGWVAVTGMSSGPTALYITFVWSVLWKPKATFLCVLTQVGKKLKTTVCSKNTGPSVGSYCHRVEG